MSTSRSRQLLTAGLLLAALSLGLPWDAYAGTWSTARFFIVAAFALALIGWRLGRGRLMRAATLVGAAGIALHVTSGLTGGAIALGLAACCFWSAARGMDAQEISPCAG